MTKVSPRPTNKRKIVKKHRGTFRRHHADRHARLSRTGYRHPRGIDNRMRRQLRGARPLVKVGYGSDRRTAHLLPCHFYKHRVWNQADLEVLLMHTGTHAAQIAHTVSARNRLAIVERAKQLGIKVLNADTRHFRTQDVN